MLFEVSKKTFSFDLPPVRFPHCGGIDTTRQAASACLEIEISFHYSICSVFVCSVVIRRRRRRLLMLNAIKSLLLAGRT